MQLETRIFFIIVVPDGKPEQATPMQGFAPSLCRNSWMVRAAAFLPSTIFDLTEEGQETLLARRISGNNPINWYGQSPNAVRALPQPAVVPFSLILLGEDQSAADYREWAANSEVPPTIVAKSGGDLTFTDLTEEGLRLRFLQICDAIPSSIDPESTEDARAALQSWRPTKKRQLGYQVGGHNSVAPNLIVLTSAGYDDMVYGPFKDINNGVKPYVDQIVRTANSIFDERDRVGERDTQRIFRQGFDLNLFAPSIYPHFLEMPMPTTLPRDQAKRFMLVKQALQRQSGYNSQATTPAQMQALFGIEAREGNANDQEPTPHPLFHMRRLELDLGTDAMAALATSEFSAVIRLPNDVNRAAGLVRSFAAQYRSDNPTSRKRLLAFREIQSRLATAFPTEFLDLIRRSKTGIRIVADAHLEWLDLDGLPLGIRKNVARLPTTPGNLFIDNMGPQERIFLSHTAFSTVLVISALDHDDPIRGMFETAFEVFEAQWKDRLTVQFVEVADEEELVAALTAFDGPMVVFDGHGGHDEDGPAALYLKGKPVDVWSLRDRISRVPPIVVLSACDTHAADRNHATTANGFLALGARTVLASVFPLHGSAAAIFTARFLYRVSTFLPAAIGAFDQAITWSEVVSGMLRMQLLTDYLRRLEAKGLLDKEGYLEVHQTGNMAINGNAADPFAAVDDLLVARGLERQTLRAERDMAVANSATISYIQLGRPETIIIDDPARIAEQFAERTDPVASI